MASAMAVAWAARASGAVAPYTAFAWVAPAAPQRHVVALVRYQSSSDPARVAAELMSRPAGARALLRWESNDNHLWRNRLDLLPTAAGTTRPAGGGYLGPWVEHGAAAEAAFEDRFAGELAERRATPDLLVLDTEMGLGTWSLTRPQLAAMVADPRWPAVARRFGLHETAGLVGTLDTPAARRFNLAMQVTVGEQFRQSLFDPWRRRFPTIHGSDFGDGVLDDAAAATAPDDNGVVQPQGRPMHGDRQSPCCYAWVHAIGRPPANRGADFTRPLPPLCWLASEVRGYAPAPEPVLPWVAAKSWTDGSPDHPAGTVAIRDTPWQDELVWHVCLSGGCTSVLYFNPDGRPGDDAAMDADLAELQAHTGGAATLQPLTTDPVPFTADVLVSGAVTPAGRRVYRVTVGTIEKMARAVRVDLAGDARPVAVPIRAGACGAWVTR